MSTGVTSATKPEQVVKGRTRWLWGGLLIVVAALIGFGIWLAFGTESEAEMEATALEELVTQEQTILETYYGNADPSVYVAMYADEMTYFDPWSGGKLTNEAARDHLMAFEGAIPPFDFEIQNPSVDLFGDTAIFTFNVQVIDPADGTFLDRWNTTEIHRRTPDGWELVHAHWGIVGGEVPREVPAGS